MDNQNNQRKIDDIFSDTETPVKPAVFQQKASEPLPPAGAKQPMENNNLKKIGILAGIVFCLAILGYGGYWLYGKYANNNAAVSNNMASEIDSGSASSTAGGGNSQNNSMQNNQAVLPDKDQDGLTDEEENKLGTKSDAIDSDGDGLFDREEVKVYKTDPLKADTDGDGHSDYEEVKAGYNPNGSGTLYDLKK